MISNEHIFITSSCDIDMICSPLFENSKINHFEFMRVFPDRTCIWLTSNANFVKKLSSKEWSNLDYKEIENVTMIEKGCYFWNCFELQSNRRSLVLQEFDISHGLTIKESYGLHQDYFIFGAQHNNFELYQFYVNNIEFVHRFIFYFKDKASLIIKKALENKITIPGKKQLIKEFELSTSSIQKSIPIPRINKYIFTFNDRIIRLSSQELNCIKLLARAYTIKEIGKFLDISPRTVEYYLQCVREKTGLSSNKNLIQIYWNTSLSNIL